MTTSVKEQKLHLSDCAHPIARNFPIRCDEIRVIDLLPGSDFDAVILDCRVINLAANSGYEALSYVWGDAKDKCVVNISGFNIEITQVLYSALVQLRYARKKRTLWVDQICINQSDDDEKSHQVSLMRSIYKRCSQCVIWLGLMPNDKRFQEMDAAVALDFIEATACGRTERSKNSDCSTHMLLADSDQGDRARKAFRALTMGGNPWWSRVWTLQEASLPFTATLHWGSLTVSLQSVELAAKVICAGWLGAVPATSKVAEEYRDLVSSFLYPVRGLTIAREGESPLNTLMRWRYRKATDPRDKVYGFAGLFDADTLRIMPSLRDISYTIESATLFARVTRDLLCCDQDLRALVGARELPHVTPGLPTWAIDFASSSDIGPRQTQWWQHSHRYLRWTACKGIEANFESSDDESILRLLGILIDNVQRVSEIYHVNTEEEVDNAKVRECIVSCYHLLNEYQILHNSDFSADYVGGGTLKDAFWRTMLGNLIMGEKPRGVPHDYDMVDFEEYVTDGKLNRLTLSLHGLVPNHAFFITTKGYIGIGPCDMQEGDCVYIFAGGHVPFVVRPINTQDLGTRYQLVGDAYVHGTMRGEAMKDVERQLRTITLV